MAIVVIPAARASCKVWETDGGAGAPYYNRLATGCWLQRRIGQSKALSRACTQRHNTSTETRRQNACFREADVVWYLRDSSLLRNGEVLESAILHSAIENR